MFSGLSKLADKPFILGYFIPALFGLAGIVLANQDMRLFQSWLTAAKAGDKHLGDVVVFLFVLWAVAILLMQLNISIFKVFEGYDWPFNHKFFVNRQIKRYRAARKPFDDECSELEKTQRELARLEAQAKDLEDGQARLTAMKAQVDAIRVRANHFLEGFNDEYIQDERYILGTRLGNVIRCF